MNEDWQTVTIAELATTIKAGGTPSRKRNDFYGGDIPFVKIEDMTASNGFLYRTQETLSDLGLAESSAWLVPAGTVLLAMYASIGEVAINKNAVATNQAILAIVPDPGKAQSDFLLFALLHSKPRLASLNVQTTQKNINKGIVERFQIMLPPLPEQQAIADILRVLQQARDARRRELTAERERKAALTYDLFAFGTRVNGAIHDTEHGPLPARWPVKSLSDCASVQTGAAKGRDFKGAMVREVPYLRVANVQDGHLDLTEMKTITIRESEMERYRLHDGDVVLTEGGDFDKLGRGFVWTGQIPDCIHQNHVFAVRVNPELLVPHFLAYLAGSRYGKSYFLSVAHKTTNLACINTTKLKAFPVPLPPLDEQQEIAAALIACDGKIATLEAEAALHDELFRALLEELLSGRVSTRSLIEDGAGEGDRA